jgi:hypothetical protein
MYVWSGRFDARKHEGLLESEPLVDEEPFLSLQRRFRTIDDEAERREIALEFEQAEREKADAGDELTMSQVLHAMIGPNWGEPSDTASPTRSTSSSSLSGSAGTTYMGSTGAAEWGAFSTRTESTPIGFSRARKRRRST